MDVIFSFDTTGSMYPCLAQVRRKLREIVTRLFSEIPGLRVGLIAHGDYCDEGSTYLTRVFELNRDVDALCKFVDEVGPTGGGDLPEAYEYVLHQARGLQWTADAGARVLVMIGDDVAHGPSYPQNRLKLDWRVEAAALAAQGVNVYAVQALNCRHATAFYKELAEVGGGYHLPLAQLGDVVELIQAIVAQQLGPEALELLEQAVLGQGRLTRNVGQIFDTLLKRDAPTRFAPPSSKAAVAGRFQVLDVDRDCAILDFVRSFGLIFQKGRGFYQFTKSTVIQGYKEVVVFDRITGDTYTNDAARELVGIPIGGSGKVSPNYDRSRYDVFVQSTSVNRALKAGTKFLYEVSGWDR